MARSPSALHLSYHDLRANLSPVGVLHVLGTVPGKMLLFYCAFGERSAMAVQAAQDAGFTSARHIEGGINAWKRAGGVLDQVPAGMHRECPMSAPVSGP